jgi:hypothetical protein
MKIVFAILAIIGPLIIFGGKSHEAAASVPIPDPVKTAAPKPTPDPCGGGPCDGGPGSVALDRESKIPQAKEAPSALVPPVIPAAQRDSPAPQVGFVVEKHPDTRASLDPPPPVLIAVHVADFPGAFVCQNLDSVEVMTNLYKQCQASVWMDAITNGQDRLIHAPVAEPDFESVGCAMVPAGTPMELVETYQNIPVVKANLNGRTIQGVTYPSMLAWHR